MHKEFSSEYFAFRVDLVNKEETAWCDRNEDTKSVPFWSEEVFSQEQRCQVQYLDTSRIKQIFRTRCLILLENNLVFLSTSLCVCLQEM